MGLVDAFGVPGSDEQGWDSDGFLQLSGKIYLEQRRNNINEMEAFVAKCVIS